MIDRYRRWFDYEKDSHAKTLASLYAVPAKLRDGEAFRKAVYLMGHIVAARRMWLFRFGVAGQNVELFPRGQFCSKPARLAGAAEDQNTGLLHV